MGGKSQVRRVVTGIALAGSLAAAMLISPEAAPAAGHPAEAGYFETVPPGSWSELPSDATCARRVHESTWEPRPDNAAANHRMPDAGAVRRSLASRPRSALDTYDPRWDSWLLARVTGGHVGTTDENIQWAACKWGLSDNLLRAVAIVESTWFQYLADLDGRCAEKRGCGDLFPKRTEASEIYCQGLAQHGYDYQRDYGDGLCPKTFSIVGVMSWQDPAWTPMAGNQNGTFPFNRDSTAFALDYYGAFIRGCMEGWIWWLTGKPEPTSVAAHDPGRLWGCVGTWYAGAWQTAAAKDYVRDVQRTIAAHTWLKLGTRHGA